MARRARELEIDTVPLPRKPSSSSSSSSMLALGRAHELHAVGELLGATGARASMCSIVGSFYDPPPGPNYPRCEKCFPPANSEETVGKRRAK